MKHVYITAKLALAAWLIAPLTLSADEMELVYE